MNRKLGLILLALILCITQAPVASASEIHHQPDLQHAEVYSDGIIMPFYTLISSIHGTCYIENGKLHMSGTVSSGGQATYAKVTITLQSNSGGGWKDGTAQSATGTKSATKTASATPKSGVLYRLKIYGYVSNASGSDSDTIYTKSVAL